MTIKHAFVPSLALLIASSFLIAPVAVAADDAEDDEFARILSRDRWTEGSYGVSLRPPLGARLIRRTADDALLQILQERQYTMKVYIKRSDKEMKIEQVARTAMNQFVFAYPDAVELEPQRIMKPAGRPGWLIYFGVNIPARDGNAPRPDRDALARVASLQLDTAVELFKNRQEIDAYRMFKTIAKNSPDRAVAAKAQQWVNRFEVDRAFMARFLEQEALRKKLNERGDKEPWVTGQAFVQLSPMAFIVVQLETPYKNFEDSKKVFEGMVKSILVRSPKEMEAERERLLNAGDQLRKMLNHRLLKTAMLPETVLPIVDNDGRPQGKAPLRLQYQRILKDGQDVGWMKVVHRERRDDIVVPQAKNTRGTVRPGQSNVEWVKKELGVIGIGVDVYARMHMGPRAIDSVSRCFQSQDGNFESWSIRTSVRGRTDFRDPKLRQQAEEFNRLIAESKKIQERTWYETGVRNGDQVTVIRQGPSGITRHTWRTPPDGYLSQVQLYLLAPLLPRKETDEWGFYAYYPNTGTISLRTVRVVPDGDSGGFHVYSRPSPEEPEQVTHYTSDGMMTKRELAEDRQIVPTTRQELANIWNIDLQDQIPDKIDRQPLPPSTDRVPR